MNILSFDIGSRIVKIIEPLQSKDGGIKFEEAYFSDIIQNPVNFSNDIFKYLKLSSISTNIFYINLKKIMKKIKNYEIYVTGYGKNNLNLVGNRKNISIIPELKAHFKGGLFQSRLENFILLDIGGQDTKVILAQNKKMCDFATNDKCAASSGRFIENMEKVLGINNIGDYFENPRPLNSTCAVFGESELIGLLSNGVEIKTLAASVNYSLYLRLKKLLLKFTNLDYPIIFVGGLTKNKALNYYIKQDFDNNLIIPMLPHHNAVLGQLGSERRFSI
ncbi:MAG: acyl-CoA dehydratase activase [Candidatus Muiribacteriota bacterium]